MAQQINGIDYLKEEKNCARLSVPMINKNGPIWTKLICVLMMLCDFSVTKAISQHQFMRHTIQLAIEWRKAICNPVINAFHVTTL